jgi:SAM-dependent methyltransferase
VDVGSGTGIAARILAQRGLRVVGIEPNADMRQRAQSERALAGMLAPEYRTGRAEETGLPGECADLVLAAQSFHWFDKDKALAESHRILKRGGWVVLMWNERDERDAFTAAYGAVIRRSSEGRRMESMRCSAAQALWSCPLFQEKRCAHFAHEQVLSEEEMIGRALSVSYAPKENPAQAAWITGLRQVFFRFQVAGRVALKYQTSVYRGRKNESMQAGLQRVNQRRGIENE